MKFDYLGYAVAIHVEQDETMREPWNEHDGHGPVSKWTTREKRPGERILNSSRGRSYRYYDYEAAIAQAKAEGWGITDEEKRKLGQRLGKAPTAAQITEAAVDFDFQYLKNWCDNKWHWLMYKTTITEPNGNIHRGDCCGGYDDEPCMLEDAVANAKADVDKIILTRDQTMMAEAWP